MSILEVASYHLEQAKEAYACDEMNQAMQHTEMAFALLKVAFDK